MILKDMLKDKLQILAEKVSGKKCENCKHYNNGICHSKNQKQCCERVFPVGWEK